MCVGARARFFPSFCSFKWTNYDYYYRMVGRREKERASGDERGVVEILDPFHDKRPYNILQAASFCPADLA